jgi:hypothetical protein
MLVARSIRSQDGQGSVEWVGLVFLVAGSLLAVLAIAPSAVPGVGLARAIAAKIVCAAGVGEGCPAEIAEPLTAAYGATIAQLVRDDAPRLVYEAGSRALPVDFRACRGAICGNGPSSGAVTKSDTGVPATAFVHVVDCRGDAIKASTRAGFDCGDGRAGNLYVQYWLYYEDSTSLRDLPGAVGHHEDDWESFDVRVTPGGVENRASSHHGYNYDGGVGSWLSDAGLVHRSAWGAATGVEYVSGGSHAGHVHEDDPPQPSRWTPASALELIPIESLSGAARHTRFAIDPPWRKGVYRDPESEGT